MLDERSVSWRILLSHRPGGKVLTVGLDAGGIVGLARSWEKVDCVSPQDVVAEVQGALPEGREWIRRIPSLKNCQEEYALVVLASPAERETVKVPEIADRLKPDGVLVCLGFAGCDLKGGELRRAGFQNIRRYAALPNCQPRVFFPLSSGRLVAKGLGFHFPGSRRAQRMTRIAKLLAGCGCKAHLKKGSLVVATRDLDSHREETLGGYFSRRLGYPIKDFAVYAGSDTSRRKITALAVAAGKQPDLVVKISDTAQGAEAIRQETEALRALAASPLADQVPKLVVEDGKWNGYTIQVQSAAPRCSSKQIRRLTDQHIEFLAELATMGRTVQPLQSTKTWWKLLAMIDKTNMVSLRESVLQAIDLVQSKEYAKTDVVCHFVHGDFAPWNIRRSDGRIFVMDWEESETEGLWLSDLFHFICRQASLVGPWAGASPVIQSFSNAVARLRAEAHYPEFDWRETCLVWALYEYLVRPTANLHEVLAFLLKMRSR